MIFFESTWVSNPTKENDLMDIYIDDVTFVDSESYEVKYPKLTNAYYENETLCAVLENAEGFIGNVYGAEYGTDGRLLGITVKPLNVVDDKEVIEVPYTKKNTDSIIRMYAWGENQNSICESEVLEEKIREK